MLYFQIPQKLKLRPILPNSGLPGPGTHLILSGIPSYQGKPFESQFSFQISVGILLKSPPFGNCQNLENVYNVFSENTPLKKCQYPIFLIDTPTFLGVHPHIHCCSSDGGGGGGGRIFRRHRAPPLRTMSRSDHPSLR